MWCDRIDGNGGAAGRLLAVRRGRGRRRLHAGEADRGAPAHREDHRGVHQLGGAAPPGSDGIEGLGVLAAADQAGWRPRAVGAGGSRAVRRPGSRQEVRARGGREGGARRVVCHHLRRAVQPVRAADHALRHGGTEGGVSPAPHRGRHRRRLRAQRVRLRVRRAGRAHQGHEAGRRQLVADRREDVDLERRVRGSLHRLRQGGRRAVHGLPGRARLPRRVDRQRRAQDGAARLVHDARRPAGRARARRQRAGRDRPRPQGGAEHAELRAVQPGRDVRGRVQGRASATPRATPRAASSSASRSRASAPSSTSWAR